MDRGEAGLPAGAPASPTVWRNGRFEIPGRFSLFELLDRRALRPLPGEHHQYNDWETHRSNVGHYSALDHHWYSVPYRLVHQQVELRATAPTVEIFHRGVRVASNASNRLAPHEKLPVGIRLECLYRGQDWKP